MSEKYRITIPYRNRENNLNKILPILTNYLSSSDYIVQVVEQDNNELFNLAYLVNIGFDIFNKNEPSNDWTYIFHPVDCYPIDVDYNVYDYDIVAVYQHGEIFPKSFIFKSGSYKHMNGYSNDYWGWGGEDWEPEKRAGAFGLSYHKRYVSFDKTEDISTGDQHTNYANLMKIGSKNLNHFTSNGLNTIDYKINSIDSVHGINIYKVTFGDNK